VRAGGLAVYEEVETRFFGMPSAASLEGEKRFVNGEVFGDGFAGGGGVFVERGEIARADDARNDRTPRFVHEGFGSGRLLVPTVSGECPAVETARVEVEENRVFAWRGSFGVGRLGE